MYVNLLTEGGTERNQGIPQKEIRENMFMPLIPEIKNQNQMFRGGHNIFPIQKRLAKLQENEPSIFRRFGGLPSAARRQRARQFLRLMAEKPNIVGIKAK